MSTRAVSLDWTDAMTLGLLEMWETFLADRHSGNLHNYDYKAISEELNKFL